MTGWTPPEPSAPPPGWGDPTWAGHTGPGSVPPWGAPPNWQQPYAAPPAPRPGIIPLRPLGVGELLDGAFSTIRRYPRPTLGFAAIVMAVVQVVQVLVTYFLLSDLPTDTTTIDGSITTTQATDLLARAGVVAVVAALLVGLTQLLLTGMVTTVVGQGVLGRDVSVSEAWQRLRPVFGRLIAVVALVFVGPVVIVAAALVPAIVVAALSPGAAVVVVLLVIAATIAAVYLFVSWALAPAVVVLERQPALASMRRSRALVRGSWWRVFWVLLLAQVIASIVSGILSVPFNVAAGGAGLLGDSATHLSFLSLALRGLGGLVAGTVVRPFTAGVGALLYIDRRMRSEALDMKLQAASTTPVA